MSKSERPAHHPMPDLSNTERYQASKRVTWVSVWVNLLLTVAQVIIGFIGHSQALIADGFHTLSDLVTDFMVLFALKQGRKAADAEHPYGHARIETAVTLGLGGVLVAVGIGITVSAALKLLRAETFVIPSQITLWVAGFTLISKELLYRYLMVVANRYDSNMLRANAWHSRSDAISSLVVVVGIGGALFGFGYLDSIAALVVAAMVIKVGAELSWQSLRELVDTGLGPEQVARIRETILTVNGVKALHLLRTRHVGAQVLVDVHIIVDSAIAVSEGHQIGEQVRRKLIGEHDEVADVMVHIDIEDDVQGASTESLPLRDVLIARLEGYFKEIEQARAIEKITLHYVEGRVRVELWVPLAIVASSGEAAALTHRFRAAAQHDPQIAGVDVAYH
jgi:cation diffusion facilitator family transporter